MKKIKVPVTERELEELQEGKKFVWIFDGVEVTLLKEEEEE
jgi:hypothetical protein